MADHAAGAYPLFGVYVHWPFCAAKCPYCDFNSHVCARVDHAAWARALCAEIDHYAALTPGRVVTSVFFGGGTPSLMEPETVQAVIAQIQRRWRLTNDCEVTLEANPTSIEAGKFRAFRQAGVNRVSVGVQALDDADLKFLGRKHTAAEALAALAIARDTFERFSFDLIYARPQQSAARWREELSRALEFSAGHLSLYQLTIEPGTPFFTQHQRGDFHMPVDEAAGELFEITQDMLSHAGLPAYEISNHAAPGQESRHNLTYWRYGDYAGIGPGAHGRLTLDGKKQATRGHRAPEIWLERVNEHGYGGHDFEEVGSAQRFTEALMMGLRLSEGIPLKRLSAEAGRPWEECVDAKKLRVLRDENMLAIEDGTLTATAAGRQRLNGLLAYLL